MPAPDSARRPNIDVAVASREAVRAERLRTERAKQRQKRREDLLGHIMIILFCALLGSGVLWLIKAIWDSMLG